MYIYLQYLLAVEIMMEVKEKGIYFKQKLELT